jgi:hypothetical protein
LASPLIPNWCHPNHPLHFSNDIRRLIRKEHSPYGIFLNIPYSQRYTKFEIAVLATVTAYGLIPRMAKQESGLSVRLHKIARMMLSCELAFTDLTYVKRLNMPFELGILLAWGKDNFVVSAARYESLQRISDLNFGDIHYHERSVEKLIKSLSAWLKEHYPGKAITLSELLQRYRRWQEIKRELGRDFDQLSPQEIDKMLKIAQDEYKMKLPVGQKRRRPRS